METEAKRARPAWAPLAVLVALAAWAGALYGVLQIHRYPEVGKALGHGVCGPWGCAARPEALLGYHLFWLTLLGPIGLVLGLRLQPPVGRLVWRTLFACGAGLTLAITGWAVFECLTTGPEHLRQYWLQIAGFNLATNTDVPAAQVAISGLACLAGKAIHRLFVAKPPATADTLRDPAERSPAAAAGSPASP